MAVLLLLALPAAALTLTLDHHRVDTKVEHIPVALYITGPVTVDFNEGNVAIRADASIDLGELQKNFAAIVLARTIDHKCGVSVTLKNAALSPANGAAEVTATATIRRTPCDAGTPVTNTGAVSLRLQPRIAEHGQLAFDITPGPATDPALAALLKDHEISEAFASMIAGTLTSSTGAASVTTALHRDAASYDPKIESVAFERLPENRLGSHLIVTLTVPMAKFFEWNLAK